MLEDDEQLRAVLAGVDGVDADEVIGALDDAYQRDRDRTRAAAVP